MTFHEDLLPTILRDTTQGAVAGVAALNNAEYHALRGYAFRAVIRDTLAVGTRIAVQNVTSADVRLFSTASTPAGSSDWKLLQPGKQMINETGDVGAWAYCVGDAGVTVVTI